MRRALRSGACSVSIPMRRFRSSIRRRKRRRSPTTLCAETLWCGHVFADLERQAQFGEFIRHRERPTGVSLDAVQTVPDGVRVNMQLGGGIGDRALIGKPRPEGVEEDIFFLGWQVVELAQDDGCHLLRYFGCTDGGNSEHGVVEYGHTAVLAAAGVQCDAGVAECLRGVS